jgi:hypothetical protein
MTRHRKHYEEIFPQLSRAELQKGAEGLAELSLGPDLFGTETKRFLRFYTAEGVEIALRKYGFFADIEQLGFQDLRIQIDTSDPDEHLLRLWAQQTSVSSPLVELVVRRSFLRPQNELAERFVATHVPVLTVEWLNLQNPRARFTAERPPLPGQSHPGLGVGAQVMELLRNVCRRLQLGGIVTIPSYFHNALFYSEEFYHFDPRRQGAFLALRRDLLPDQGSSITAATWALKWKMVRDCNTGKPFVWFQDLMVNPISDELSSYFDAPAYRDEVQQALQSHRFELFEAPLDRALQARGIVPFDAEKVAAWSGDS